MTAFRTKFLLIQYGGPGMIALVYINNHFAAKRAENIESLLPDTKLTKYKIQLILIRDLPCYLTQKMQTPSDIQRQQIPRQTTIHPLLHILQRLKHRLQRRIMPGISNNSRFRI